MDCLEWWQQILPLFQDRPASRAALYAWADRLSEMSRTTRRVPASTIRSWMDAWRADLTVEEILDFQPK